MACWEEKVSEEKLKQPAKETREKRQASSALKGGEATDMGSTLQGVL